MFYTNLDFQQQYNKIQVCFCNLKLNKESIYLKILGVTFIFVILSLKKLSKYI